MFLKERGPRNIKSVSLFLFYQFLFIDWMKKEFAIFPLEMGRWGVIGKKGVRRFIATLPTIPLSSSSCRKLTYYWKVFMTLGKFRVFSLIVEAHYVILKTPESLSPEKWTCVSQKEEYNICIDCISQRTLY